MLFANTEQAECVRCGDPVTQDGLYCLHCRATSNTDGINHRPERKYYDGKRGCVVCQRSRCVCYFTLTR